MKKLVALLLGTAMVATSIAGLAACNKGGGGGGGNGGGKTEITRRADPRDAEAYEAYDYEGTKVGAYKTIAAAINATVKADLDLMEDEETPDGTTGGYVIKKGGTRHLFDNKKGFAEGNEDQFWYYQEGTMLAGYNCWDGTTGLSEMQNRKIIVHETTDFGLKPIQTWNGYGLLDAHGQEIPNTTLPNSYELASPLDAGVIAFTGENKGISGLHYKLDLSEVQIMPAYEGVEEDVYAFFGFYTWQGYYVIASGIACNTLTGEWYPFRGTSRDNSFSDVIYNVDELKKPLMTSSWNKEGGYWVPDVKEVDMTIKTTRNIDPTDDALYWTDEMSITFDGENEYKLTIDDAMVNNYFTGNAVSPDNGYEFIAGLDIKSKEEKENPGQIIQCENVDYFNGAKFENLIVSEAQVYFPAEEEISDLDLVTIKVNPDWRGQWFDILMASEEYTEGTYGYTILQNYTCTSYESKDGVDYYSFNFDLPATAENEIGGMLKEYQDKIDRLSEMTVDNIKDYLDDYNEVTRWYGSDESHTGAQGILQQYLLLVDFSAYVEAQEVYRQSFKLTDEGNAVLADLETLSLLTNYNYKGWTTTGDDVSGYFWSEAQKFNDIYTRYQALPEEDRSAILRLYNAGEDAFTNWLEAYTSVKAYLDAAGEETYTIADRSMNGKDVTYTAEQALEKLFELGYKIWTKSYTGAAEPNVMDSDSTENFQDSFHLLFLMKRLEEDEVELPAFFEDVIYAQITSTSRSAGFALDFNEYLYPVLTLSGEIYKRQTAGEYVWLDSEIAEVINTYMVEFEDFNEAGFRWNLSNNKDLRNGNTNYEHYFGLPDANFNFFANLDYIFDVVASCDPTAEKNARGLGFKSAVTPLKEDPTKSGSEAAKAIVKRIQEFVALDGYAYKGWTTDAADKSGYLFDDLTKFRTLVADRGALSVVEQAYVSAQLKTAENQTASANYDAWTEFSTEIENLEADEIWKAKLNGFDVAGKATEYTAAQALDQLFYSVWLNRTKALLPNGGDDLGGKEYTDYNDEDIFFSATWAAMFYQFFADNDAVELLPAQIQGGLKAAGFEKYYEEVFCVLYQNVKIAGRIAGDVKKMEDFTDEELAFLNKVWTANYEIGAEIASAWNDNRLQEAWKARCDRVILLAGGTLKEGEAAYRYDQYMAKIAAFLEENHYTVNGNGWGTTASEIYGVTLTDKTLAIVEEFAKIGNLDTYKALGWQASDAAIKGYLYSEAQYYENTIKGLLADLGDKEQGDVAMIVGAANMQDWATLAPAVLALDAEKASLVIEAADSDKESAKQKNYTAGEALGVLLQAIADANAIGEKFSFDNGIHYGVSFRPYFFYIELEARGIEIPAAIMNRFNATKMAADAAAKFEEDIRYIITVMKIAKAVTADAEHKLTAEEIAMINATMVGKDKFQDPGFEYAFTVDGPTYGEVVSWHGNSKGYKTYFGLSLNNQFSYYQNLVVNYLVKNYKATAIHYNKAGAPETAVMGIEAEITATAE